MRVIVKPEPRVHDDPIIDKIIKENNEQIKPFNRVMFGTICVGTIIAGIVVLCLTL